MTDRNALRLERTFAAARPVVFAAWTDPEVLRRWWAAAPTWTCPLAEVDLRVGGAYRLSMADSESDAVHTVAGEYLEVTPPERLVYTWTWEGADAGGDGDGTVVTVEFREAGPDLTTVVLTHAGLGAGASAGRHRDGWTGCLDNLASRVFPAVHAAR